MQVIFKQDVTVSGTVCAKAGTVGIVRKLIGSSKLQVKFEQPLVPNIQEAIVMVDVVEVVGGGIRNLVLRRINVDDIDLANYELFKAECDEVKGYVDPIAAMEYSIQAANIGAGLSSYRALIDYNETELDREVKHAYAMALSSAEGSSQDKREAQAKQDTTYQTKLKELAEIRSAKLLVSTAYDYALNMYYLFKEVYRGERNSTTSSDPNDR